MKKQIGLLLLAAGLLNGCVSGKPRHISASEFERRCRYIGSVDDNQYLGRLADRAYLRYSYIPLLALIFDTHPKELPERIFYVNLSELDKPFRDSLPPTQEPKKMANPAPYPVDFQKVWKQKPPTDKSHDSRYLPFPGPVPIRDTSRKPSS